jgi:hypothetical protein
MWTSRDTSRSLHRSFLELVLSLGIRIVYIAGVSRIRLSHVHSLAVMTWVSLRGHRGLSKHQTV